MTETHAARKEGVATAQEFLEAIAPPGALLEFRCLEPTGEWSGAVRTVGYASQAQALLDRHQDRDIFYGCGTRRDRQGGGGKGNVAELHFLWVDLDHRDSLQGFPDQLDDENIPPPSVIINSGGGFHILWLLDAPIALDGKESWKLPESILRGLAKATGGDKAVAEVARILRLPGSWNHKEGVDGPCEIVELHPERVYPLEDFLHLADISTARGNDNGGQAGGVVAAAGDMPAEGRNNTLTRLGGGLRRQGCSEGEILDMLRARNASFPEPLPDHEVSSTARSVARYEPAPHMPTRSRGQLNFMSISELAKHPRPTWLIEGVLAKGDLACLFGAPGGGKSFVAIDMAMHLAAGEPWAGRRVPRPCRVAYVMVEGTKGALYNRIDAFTRGQHEAFDDERAEQNILLHCEPFLLTAETVESTIASLREFDPDVVIFDTLARSMVGDENSQKDMGEHIHLCDRIRHEVRCAVINIHHSGLGDTKRERGSSVLRGAVDRSMLVEKNGNVVKVTDRKAKESMGDEEMRFRLDIVKLREDDDGIMMTSCSLNPLLGPLPDDSGKTAREAILQVVADFGDGSGLTRAEVQRMGKLLEGTARKYLKKLKDEGFIENIGTAGTPKYVLAERPDGEG